MSSDASAGPFHALGQSPPLPVARSRRTRQIARWFALDVARAAIRPQAFPLPAVKSLVPSPGKILLISGASGSGKSSLLEMIRKTFKRSHVLDLNRIILPDQPLVDCFGAIPLQQVLGLLSRVGLAEAWGYLRTPAELSEGQRWRLRLALAISRSSTERRTMILCDEFCALLDRVTAAVVSRSLRRIVSASGLRAIVATSHDDLLPALLPDLHARCDFGEIRIDRRARGIASKAARR